MSVSHTATVTTSASTLIIDDWGIGTVTDESATAYVSPPRDGTTRVSFSGTVYAPIPLPDIPGVLQDISLDSIQMDSYCFFLSSGVSVKTKDATAEIKCGTTTKGHIAAIPQGDRTTFIVGNIGEWSKAEITSDQLRVYFSVDISATNSSASSSAALRATIHRSEITATWTYTTKLPLLGDTLFIGG